MKHFALLCFLGCAVAASISCRATADQTRPGQVDLGSGSSWFVVPVESDVGDLAFLVGFDAENSSGRLFLPPRMLELSPLSGIANRRRFVSDLVLHDPVRRFEFEGSISTTLDGTLRVISVEDQSPIATWRAAARRLVVQSSSPPRGLWPIRVSDAGYSAEGGDWTGVDLEIFSTGDGPVGIAVIYDSWIIDRPEPLLMKNIATDGRDITFDLKTDRVRRFRISFENAPTAVLSHLGDEGPVSRSLRVRDSRVNLK